MQELRKSNVKLALMGVKFGRKPKLSSEQIDHARDQIEGGKTAQKVTALLNVGRMTLWRALKA